MKCDELNPVFVDMSGNIVANELGELYYKPEVDAAIAELKAQKAQTEDDCAYWKAKAQRGRHANYKRCVAMWLYLRGCYWRCKYHNEQTRADWYNKWMNVYQKLAEKFKEAK